MFLGAIAERWVNEPVEAFNEETGLFEPFDFPVRVSLVDRFLSNFNRPLRRRMLHYAVDKVMPDSMTIKIVATGDVYLIGQARTDSDNGGQYHELALAHLVTDEGPNSSAGLAQVYRWTPDGPADDPGWLTKKHVGQHYCDTEFRTSLNEADLVDERVQAFVMFMQKYADLREHDQVVLHDREYRVTDTTPDSGLMMARIDREGAYFVDFSITVKGDKQYDKEQMRYVATERTYNVTGLLNSEHDYTTWSTDSDDFVLLSVKEDHIGFRPEAGMEVVWEGRTRTIRHAHYYRGEREYKLRCR